MYTIEAKTNKGTAERQYKRLKYAQREAARVANAGSLYVPNPELWPSQNWCKVFSVRLYDSNHPETDIDF